MHGMHARNYRPRQYKVFDLNARGRERGEREEEGT